jgi:cysteine protease ATG4
MDYPKPLLLLVTTRLGLSGIESYYYDAIKSCFSEELPQCVGILGGKPNFALYFVGMQESNHLIFLDPHFVQDSVTIKHDLNTYFPNRHARKIKLDSLDPGLAIGLLIRNSADLKSI